MGEGFVAALPCTPQDELMPRYAELVYNGFWFSPERQALQAAIDRTQQFCTGEVKLKLYKVSPRRVVQGVGVRQGRRHGVFDPPCFIQVSLQRLASRSTIPGSNL